MSSPTAGTTVAVMTPVRNGAEHLEECIASVLAQTHRDWVMLIADNASTDATPDIAERHARADSRIRHLRFEESVDVNRSHNRGFGAVPDEAAWCKPVSADDWIYPECLERMLEAAALSPAIGVVGAYQRCGDEVINTALPYERQVFDGREVVAQGIASGLSVLGPPSAHLIRADLIRRPEHFDVRLMHADTDAVYRVMLEHDLGFVHQVLSYQRLRPGSTLPRTLLLGSGQAEEVLLTIRYGLRTLDAETYSGRLEPALRRYARFVAKAAARTPADRVASLAAYHAQLGEMLLEESGRDARVVRTVATVRRLVGARAALRRLGV